jgi:hypothetical protein
VRYLRPVSSTLPVHFFWLFAAAVFLFAGVIWSGQKAHAEDLSPTAAARVAAEQDEADRMLLLGRLQLAGIAARRAGPPLVDVAPDRAAEPSPDARAIALARYASAVGSDSLEEIVLQSSSRLSQQVLADSRIEIGSSGRSDIAAGRVDPRVLALLVYLAEAHGQVTVSCVITGHSRYVAQTKAEKKRKAPLRVSQHMYGRAVDISALGGVPIAGNQLPGGVTDRAVQEILSLPEGLQPSQVISLLDLSGPSFRLPDHADHIHVGY